MSGYESSDRGNEKQTVQRAIEAFQSGAPVLVHDFTEREGETDLLYPAEAVTPAAVARLRNDAGGLLFVALTDEVARAFDLPFLHEIIDHPTTEYDDVGYDNRPSFSLTVNHRETYTGVTDDDRARTITALSQAAADPSEVSFPATFRSPGHVHVLRGAAGLLAGRQGHTELGLALADLAGSTPAVAGCEMLDDETGTALSKADAASFAHRNDIPFLSGQTLVRHWR